MKTRTGFVSNSSSSSFVLKNDGSGWGLATKKWTLEEVETALHKLLDFYNEFMGYDYAYDSVFGSVFVSDGKPFSLEQQYAGTSDGWDIDHVAGSIIILSESDNTIPYPVMEMIENMMGARRYHLG